MRRGLLTRQINLFDFHFSLTKHVKKLDNCYKKEGAVAAAPPNTKIVAISGSRKTTQQALATTFKIGKKGKIMSDNPLMNIGDLAEPAKVLIEKLADAGYVLYEPKHIVEVAKAKADAAIIQAEAEIEIDKAKAKAEIEITDLHRRAAQRWIAEQGQQQKSIENITIKAIPQLNENADPNAIEDDWIIKFFDKCRLVTDDKMQDLWTSILAGEANRAGSYSPKTLTALADMNQKVAALFNTFCSLGIVYLEDPNAFLKSPSNFKIRDARVPIITGSITDAATLKGHYDLDLDKFAQKSESIYQKYGFGFSEFQLLVEHGLIQDDTFSDYSHFWYNNEIYIPVNPSANPPFKTEDYQQITVSGFRLSSVGRELFHITKRDNPPEYLEHLIDFFEEYYNLKMYRFPKKG